MKYPKAKIIYLTQEQFNFLQTVNASAWVRGQIDAQMVRETIWKSERKVTGKRKAAK